MANQNALTAAHIRYLLVLLRLTAANGHTRCVDLAAALLRQGFPELTEPQTMISQLLAQVPEESLAGLCDRQAVEEAAS